MQQLTKYLTYNNPSAEVQNWIRTVLAATIKKGTENQVEIEHILDFLASDKAPTRLKKMSYAQAKAATDKWNKTLIKKGEHIQESEADIKVLKRFSDGFKLVELVGENAFKREGYLMRHCAGSYANRTNTKVLSLRDPLNMPHATFELQQDQMNQIKGKGNGSIHPDYIKKVLAVLKMFKVDVRSSEMENLGYIEVSDTVGTMLKKEFTGAKFLKIKDSEYFYVNSRVSKRS
jgi:hypothetical protein